MENKKQRRSLGDWANERFKEAPGQIFKRGKWSFWFPLLMGMTLLNSGLTATIFLTKSLYSGDMTLDLGRGLFLFLGIVVATVGALLCWISIGNLHYSDSEDGRLAKGVSILDSATLCFVIAHFCILFYVQGHLITLCADEAKFETDRAAFNSKAVDVSKDNVKIAELGVKVSELNVKAEKIQNDTAYQLRKAFEAGGARASIGRQSAASVGQPQSPSLQTSQVHLAEPEAPKESSAAFLGKWEVTIRILNFGELILAAVTLIYIRNRSAKFNSAGQSAYSEPLEGDGDVFPVATVSHRQYASQPALRQPDAQKSGPVATKSEGDERLNALNALRAHLKAIKANMRGRWFKADLIEGGVSIRLCERQEGREETIASTWQSDKILSAVHAPDFRARLVAELKHQGFPIEGKGANDDR